MNLFPETRESLLLQVRDPKNGEAWEQFVELYRPVIYRIAIARGLQDADAHDLAQQVLASVAASIGRWEKSGDANFRNWLNRVTKNAILNALMRPPNDRGAGGSSAQIRLRGVEYSNEATEEMVSLEYRRELYLSAADQVRKDVSEQTWRAFELTVVGGNRIDEVADSLGMSRGAVYSARSRVLYRLRNVVVRLERDS